MSRLLMLVHRIPFPPNKGDKIRTFNVLSHLLRHHEVSLACLVDDPDDLAHLPALRALVARLAFARIDGAARRVASLRALWPARSITVTHFHSAALQRQVDAWIEEGGFDGVLCCSAAMAEYVFRSRHCNDRLRATVKVMDLIDVDSCKWAQYAQSARPWMAWLYRHEAAQLAAYERRIVGAFDRTFLVSTAEARLLQDTGGAGRVGAFSNGVDLDYFSPATSRLAPPEAPEPMLVFTGVMDYLPNVEGVEWFVRDVFPLIRSVRPDARFAIVGSKPTRQVQSLASVPGVIVTGFVDDVRVWLGRAAVCVAPLRIARGIQNKVLEAMAMARPVVATRQAFEGVEATAGQDLLVADDARGFADAVLALLGDPVRARAMGAAARQCVERGYRWESNLAVLDEVFA
jgi:sugar transferase (PEP-CTERM/EpsH1 system associated)